MRGPMNTTGETVTMTLSEFLLARIAEDEAWARLAQDSSDSAPWHQGMGHLKGNVVSHAGLGIAEARGSNVARFISMHDPARVLGDCEAKRQIVEEVLSSPMGKWKAGEPSPWADKMLALLAAPYANHPDYPGT